MSPGTLLSELQRHKDTVRCVTLGAENSVNDTTNIFFQIVKSTCLRWSLIVNIQQSRIESVTPTWEECIYEWGSSEEAESNSRLEEPPKAIQGMQSPSDCCSAFTTTNPCMNLQMNETHIHAWVIYIHTKYVSFTHEVKYSSVLNNRLLPIIIRADIKSEVQAH